ncbi:hypothetical protein UFOVP111_140 [uncultured Caudovirales phage]|uniref:Uncharacterized protein n=1 Tax=uncultured Caudovirales phage TaxID=2100421 RepID=A0A6J5L3C6_9CAUD|nr:hypothetical protein UFOVP111_140 [uncultured Caudovirales phage]
MEIKAWAVDGWDDNRSFNIAYYTTKELAEEAIRFFETCVEGEYGYAIGQVLSGKGPKEVTLVINARFDSEDWV